MKNIFLLNILTLFLFATGCANSQTSKVKNISQTEFKKTYEKQANAQILDVRTAKEIAQGKISGAAELDYFDPDFKKKVNAMNFDKSKPIVVYCAVGGRSSKAASVLADLGFKTVLNLEGGYNSYK
jgi:rhodanese-related sulfurtransferase